MSNADAAMIVESTQLVDALRPLMADRDPLVQAMALAELLSLWLAGWPAAARDDLLADHVALVRKLTPANVAILYDGKGHPLDRQDLN